MTYGDVRDEGARINAVTKRVGYVETLMHMSGQLEFIGYRLCELVDTLQEINGKLDKPSEAVIGYEPDPPIAYAAPGQIDDDEIVITPAGVAAGMARVAALRGR